MRSKNTFAAVALIAALFAPTGGALSGDGGDQKKQPDAIVRYDGGRVTLNIKSMSVPQIIRAVAKVAGFEAEISGDFGGPISFSADKMPLVPLLRRLVGEHSMVVISRPSKDRKTRGPIARVMITANQSGGPRPSPAAAPPRRRKAGNGEWDGEHVSTEERLAAIRKLARLKTASSVQSLERTAARDTDGNVRIQALSALGTIGGQNATLALARVLYGDFDPDTRLAAMRALRTLGTDVARVFIERALEDPDAVVKAAANDMLLRWK